MNTATEQLHGWKEIACYLKRSVRCVQRWERNEGLPVRRHGHARGVSIYAFRDELHAWWDDGRNRSKVLNGQFAHLVSTSTEDAKARAIRSDRKICADACETGSSNQASNESALTAYEVTALRFLLMLLKSRYPADIAG